LSCGLLALLVGTAAPAFARQTGGVVLLTPEEAKQLRMTMRDWPPTRRTRGLVVPAGPRIVVQTPQLKDTGTGQTIETVTPANLVITFEQNAAPVDMHSLQVTARKGLFSKTLTEILAPYVQGTTLQVRNATIPQGNFLIEIEIADGKGARTVETYRLHVTER
jgi:uncharacterized protein YndB with AHSA1/START domain